MSKQAFDKKIEALEALRSVPDPTLVLSGLRKALKDPNNYVASKAAAMAGDLKLEESIPDLLSAFDRFLIDPVKSDPQCWAKNAIAKALKNLAHREPQVFVRGIAHIQLEPVWGGRADSAGTLRGTCALALVDCRLDDLEILTHLTGLLADPQTPVRVDAALAIAQFGRPEGVLPLRLKALMGDAEPEVTGQCFASLLALSGRPAIPFVQSFLEAPGEDVRAEAVSALAQSREPEALQILKDFYHRKLPVELRLSVLISLGASPLREAAEFLLQVARDDSGEFAAGALRALAASRFRTEMRDAARTVVEGKPDLLRILEREFK